MTRNENDSINFRDRVLVKRHINKEHNSNFRAGYIPVHEQQLHKTGLRGKKTCFFWLLVILVFLAAAANLILTLIILGVLRISHGMESIEFYPGGTLTKFKGTADLGVLYKIDGHVKGFLGEGMEISGDAGAVLLRLDGRNDPFVDITPTGTRVGEVNAFRIFDPKSRRPIFSTDFPNFGLPKGVKKIDIQQTQASRVVSPVNSSLFIQSDEAIHLKGNEGLYMEGREIIWSVDKDIFLKSINGSVVLVASDGVFINVESLPIVASAEKGIFVSQYKLCMCKRNMRLFRVPIPINNSERPQKERVGCHVADFRRFNPCK